MFSLSVRFFVIKQCEIPSPDLVDYSHKIRVD